MARSRNRPPRLVVAIVVGVLIVAALLCARAAADPLDREGGDLDDSTWRSGEVGVTDDGVTVDGIGSALPTAPQRRWWRGPPPITNAELVRAAYRTAGLADDPVPGWRWRARLGGLVPWVSSRIGRDDTWRDVEDPTLGHTVVFDVRATWHLDRLVFDPNEIRISAIDVSRRRERRRLAATVIRSYYVWLATGSEEVHAELDADTDGWFSEALARVRKR